MVFLAGSAALVLASLVGDEEGWGYGLDPESGAVGLVFIAACHALTVRLEDGLGRRAAAVRLGALGCAAVITGVLLWVEYGWWFAMESHVRATEDVQLYEEDIAQAATMVFVVAYFAATVLILGLVAVIGRERRAVVAGLGAVVASTLLLKVVVAWMIAIPVLGKHRDHHYEAFFDAALRSLGLQGPRMADLLLTLVVAVLAVGVLVLARRPNLTAPPYRPGSPMLAVDLLVVSAWVLAPLSLNEVNFDPGVGAAGAVAVFAASLAALGVSRSR
ncbi:hypothetical protein E1264_40330 [Actinomadura sp. KC216]|uniref:hypothetical protein n=1 Tax=Actinomadura sp. KC216 TaxID=2530370 RepID=UPI00104ED495|nr:hypothetical protein [Actinomadura sp. KC216]TDB75043.1 hypothetical protein E1264_40330 [Actinomadura sp. KC216]